MKLEAELTGSTVSGKANLESVGEETTLFHVQMPTGGAKVMKNQVTMTPPKETNRASIDVHAGTESRVISLKKLSELQEHTERKLNQ